MLEAVAHLFGVPLGLLLVVSEAKLEASDFLSAGAADPHDSWLYVLPDQQKLPDVLIFDRT